MAGSGKAGLGSALLDTHLISPPIIFQWFPPFECLCWTRKQPFPVLCRDADASNPQDRFTRIATLPQSANV